MIPIPEYSPVACQSAPPRFPFAFGVDIEANDAVRYAALRTWYCTCGLLIMMDGVALRQARVRRQGYADKGAVDAACPLWFAAPVDASITVKRSGMG